MNKNQSNIDKYLKDISQDFFFENDESSCWQYRYGIIEEELLKKVLFIAEITVCSLKVQGYIDNLYFYFKPKNISAPTNYFSYHHQNCGTLYRGCDPYKCPKDQYEKTGTWNPDLVMATKTSHLNT